MLHKLMTLLIALAIDPTPLPVVTVASLRINLLAETGHPL